MQRFIFWAYGLLLPLVVLCVSGVFSATAQPASTVVTPFKQALPGYTLRFPQDEGTHPAFKTEWWYYTGHLSTNPTPPNATETVGIYGYELTFFRTAITPNPVQPTLTVWKPNAFVLAHFAVTDVAQQRFAYQSQFERVNPYKTNFTSKPFGVQVNHWQLTTIGRTPTSNQPIVQLQAQLTPTKQQPTPMGINLTLTPSKPVVLHGNNGLSQKASCKGCASYYYSFTRLATEGTITVGDKPLPVVGTSWMDHEFGSNQLTSTQVGWDWFALQLDNNTELMVYLIRNKSAKGTMGLDTNSAATWVAANGSSTHLTAKQFTVTPTGTWYSTASGGTYPSGWQLTIPSKQVSLMVIPKVPQQELVFPSRTGLTYWEGACKVSGTVGKQAVTGNAYTELTGYATPFSQKI
jgi:predicted secreted hydrolase